MEGQGLPERIRAVIGSAADPPFDPTDPLDVDRAAAALLERFLAGNDPSVLSLLMELTESKLLQAAAHVADDVGMMMPSDELVLAFFGEVFTATGGRMRGWRQFLARATDWMRDQAECWVRDVALMDGPDDADTTMTEIRADGTRLRRPVESESDLLKQRVAIAYHRMDVEARRLLRAADLRGLSHEQIARELDLPVNQVADRILDARLRLDDGVSRLSEGDQP